MPSRCRGNLPPRRSSPSARVYASRRFHRPHPARRAARAKVRGRVGPWSVARAPVVGWTGCYERAPGRRGVTGPGPRTAQSRSARRGGGASRLCPARVGSQRAAQVDDAVGDRGGVLPGHGARSRLPDGVVEDGHLLDDRVDTGAPGSKKPASSVARRKASGSLSTRRQRTMSTIGRSSSRGKVLTSRSRGK